ncbi:hypothetical protein [Mycobacterium sp. GA-1841]|uniref:hypothetical protein n=1 Tax=Mycobacterium sp. GA-1841 TaxID=1834154 RepID=UPI00111591EF|nr:hypothetical protein [Mycobacterium sp. GA-1841]
MNYPPHGYPPPGGQYPSGMPGQYPSGMPGPFQFPGQPPYPFPMGGPPLMGQVPPQQPPPRKSKKWLAFVVVALVVIAVAGVGTVLWRSNSGNSESPSVDTASGPQAGPLPDPPAPLGALRPPRDIQMASPREPTVDPK